MFWIALLLAQTAVTPQIERGEALFFDPAKGCASCHALKGRGTAVGPDLKVIGGLAPPAIAVAARSTITTYVQNVKLKSRDQQRYLEASTAGQEIHGRTDGRHHRLNPLCSHWPDQGRRPRPSPVNRGRNGHSPSSPAFCPRRLRCFPAPLQRSAA
jgi:hypothetical protein